CAPAAGRAPAPDRRADCRGRRSPTRRGRGPGPAADRGDGPGAAGLAPGAVLPHRGVRRVHRLPAGWGRRSPLRGPPPRHRPRGGPRAPLSPPRCAPEGPPPPTLRVVAAMTTTTRSVAARAAGDPLRRERRATRCGAGGGRPVAARAAAGPLRRGRRATRRVPPGTPGARGDAPL